MPDKFDPLVPPDPPTSAEANEAAAKSDDAAGTAATSRGNGAGGRNAAPEGQEAGSQAFAPDDNPIDARAPAPNATAAGADAAATADAFAKLAGAFDLTAEGRALLLADERTSAATSSTKGEVPAAATAAIATGTAAAGPTTHGVTMRGTTAPGANTTGATAPAAITPSAIAPGTTAAATAPSTSTRAHLSLRAQPRLAAFGLIGVLGIAAVAIAVRPRPSERTGPPSPEGTTASSSSGPAAGADATRGMAAGANPADEAEGGPAGEAAAAMHAASPAARLRRAAPRQPVAWPRPELVALTAASVQQLDCPSLQAAVSANAQPPGLIAWARFRATWACADAAVGPTSVTHAKDDAGAAAAAPFATGPAVGPGPASDRRRRSSSDAMLATAGRLGLDLLQPTRGRPRMPTGSWQRTPQGRLVAALATVTADGKAKRAAARRLLAIRSLGADAPLLAAELLADEEPKAAQALLVALVRHGDGLALARASRALFTLGALRPLTLAVLSRADDFAPGALPRLLVQAAPSHRRWLLAVALRVAWLQGEAVTALEVGQLALELAPQDPQLVADVQVLARTLGLDPAAAQPSSGTATATATAAPTLADGVVVPPAVAAASQAAWQAAQGAEAPLRQAAALQLLWHAPYAATSTGTGNRNRNATDKKSPDALAALVLRGMVAGTITDEDAADARAQATQLLWHWVQVRPQDDGPLLLLAELGEALPDPAMQRDARQTLALRHPQDERAQLALALALLTSNQAGEAARAEALVQAMATTVAPKNKAEWLYVRARMVAERDPLQARQLLVNASKLQPTPRYDVFLADLLQAQGQLDEAASALARAAHAAPDDVPLQLRRAALLQQQGEWAAAREVLQQTVRRAPKASAAHAQLADVAHRLGDLPAAATALVAACAVPHPPTTLLLRLARLQLLEMGQLDAGLATLRRALAEDPRLAEAHYLLGLGARDAGDERAMARSWQTYLTLEPKGAYAAEVRQALRR